MPPLRRNLIDAMGYGKHIVELASEGKLPNAIAKELAADAEFMRKLNEIGRSCIYPSDVTFFLANEVKEQGAALEEMTNGQTGATLAVVKAKEHVERILGMSEGYADLTERGMSLLSDALDRFETKWREDPNSESNPFPFSLWDSVRKAMAESRDSVKLVRDDTKLQGIIKAGTLNVNQGMNTNDVIDILLGVGEIAGVPEDVMMDAYTKYLMAKKRKRREPIDVEYQTDASGAVSARAKVAPKRAFQKPIEASLGMPQAEEGPAAPAGG